MPVRVFTDSVSYIPEMLLRSEGITVVPLYVSENGATVPEIRIDAPGFFERLSLGGRLPTTSQAPTEDFRAVFAEAVAFGDDVLAVLVSGGMSGTVGSAELAAREVLDTSSGSRIVVVDSRANCMQEGFAVLAAAEAAKSGASLSECEQAARESMRRSRFLFSPQSLEYLRRGGRISAAGALLGSMLRIVPVLTAENGETGVAGRARTWTHALETIVRLMRMDIERFGLRQVVVQSIGDMGPGIDFAREYIEPVVGRPVQVIPIGPVIGLHVGPAVGVTYETEEPLA